MPGESFSEPQRSSWTRLLLPPIAVAALLIFAFTRSFEWHPAFLEPSWNAAYRVHDGAWQALPELPGELENLQVSPKGTVWALLWHFGKGSELARLDGASWHIYRASDFGMRSAYDSACFALDGETLWAPMDEDIIEWDGVRWQRHQQPLKGPSATSLAAAHGHVWVISEKGDLAEFDGAHWSVRKAALPDTPHSGDSDESDDPQLAATADGTLWLVWNGVWRWDGGHWSDARPSGEDLREAFLAGSSSQSIWLENQAGLVALSSAAPPRRYDHHQIGLERHEIITHVAEANGRIELATTRGILEFDGASWRRLPPPHNGVQAVRSIHSSAGSLLVIGNTPHPVARRWQILIRSIPLLLMLALLADIVWIVRLSKHRKLHEHQRLQQAVAHATGAVPEEFARDERLLARQSSWWSAGMNVGVIVAALVGFQTARLFWPRVPSWLFLVMAIALHALATLVQTLVRRTPKPWDPIEPGGARFDWDPTRRALPASLGVFLLLNLGSFPKWLGDPFIWLLNGILAVTWYKVLEEKFTVWALRRGDYDGAIRVVRLFRFYNPDSGAALASRAHLLLMAGRFAESEETARRAISRLRFHGAQAQALETLGESLLEQRRYDEAQRCYEAALRAAPGFRRPYRGMAELILRQGRDPSIALAHIQNILGPIGISPLRWLNNVRSTDDYWALKAWAFAELSRVSEAEYAFAEAIRKTNARSRPDLAATYYRLGMAMQALDRTSEAEECFEKSLATDPNGRRSAILRQPQARASVGVGRCEDSTT